jgi:nitrogen fixation protein FixH
MKKIWASFFIFTILLTTQVLAQPCEMFFKSENLCLEQKWEILPSRTTMGQMTLTFKDHEGRVISPKNTPFVLLWMPSMGHGSRPVTITLVEDGIYSVTNVKFIMGGPWDIHYQLKDGSKVVEEFIQKISI